MNQAHQFAVFGGDHRQTWVARGLRQKNYDVNTYAVPELVDTHATPEAAVWDADCVVLPMPAFSGGFVSGCKLPSAQLLACLRPGMMIFGGRFDHMTEPLRDASVQMIDYSSVEQLAALNAVPTAEGAIQLAMEHLPVTVSGSSCLVIGFGRIGKLLALKLHALNASVTVSARREKDLWLARMLGLEADQTGQYQMPLSRYDVIFNTVPAPVLDSGQLAQTREDCLLIELASLPGGIDPEQCKSLGRNLLTARGLPGKVAPATSGLLIRDTILNQL